MAVPAGSFSLHHTLCRHRSAPNRVSHRRIGLGISYIPARVRTAGSYQLSALLVRGRDIGGYFDLLPQPESEFGPAELDRHERVYHRYRQNYAQQTGRHEGRVAAV
jgi:non-heme Fe2+,alpha-ketoglutarate-dependent halogenase